MRQHKILTETLLILFTVIFALAAPVAVRKRPEVRLNANVTRDATATSQKRMDSLDESGSSNMHRWDHPLPPSPDLDAYTDNPPPTLDTLGSLSGSGHVPPSPGLPTGSRLPVAGSLSPPPENWSPNMPWSGHAPPPSPDLTEILSEMAGQLVKQHRYTDSPRPLPDSLWSSTGPRLPVGSMPAAGSLSRPPGSWSPDVPWSDHAPAPSPDLADISAYDLPPTLDSLWSLSGSDRGLPTGSRLPVGSMPVAGSLSPAPERWSPNMPGLDHAPPPGSDLTNILPQEAEQLAEQHRYTDSPVPPLDGLMSSTGSQLPVGSMPAAGSLPSSPESWLPNVPWSDHAPPSSPDLTDILSQIEEQHKYTDSTRLTPDSLGSSTGSRLPAGSIPAAGSLSPLLESWSPQSPADLSDILSETPYANRPPSTPDTPGSLLSYELPNPDYAPPSSPDLTEILSQIPSTNRPLPTPDTGPLPGSDYVLPPVPSSGHVPQSSPGSAAMISDSAPSSESMSVAGPLSPLPPPSPLPSQPGPPEHGSPVSMMDPKTLSLLKSMPFPTEIWDRVVRDSRFVGSVLAAGAFLPPLPPPPHPGQQGPSEDRLTSPSDMSENPDTSSATEPTTGDQPTPPGVDPMPETHLLNQAPWNKIGKFKFKRRISSSNAVNSAQKDSRFLKFPHRCPSSGP